MNGKVVNLRQVRKRLIREEAGRQGTENAARHGLSKAGRKAEETRRDAAIRHLDGHRRED